MPAHKKGGSRRGSRIPKTAPNVGSRTGVAVLAGKTIRKDARGMDNFDDYFTEDELSVHSDVGKSRDRHSMSSAKQSKSPHCSNKKPTTSLDKDVQRSSKKTLPEEHETSDEENLVMTGTKDGSLTISRVNRVLSPLLGKQRLSFAHSPKLNSAPKNSPKVNTTSLRKKHTSQLNNVDLDVDSSDEDLFEPVKLDWSSKPLSRQVTPTDKAASSAISNSTRIKPQLSPLRRTPLKSANGIMANKQNSSGRRSLQSTNHENPALKHSKLVISEEESDEEPIPMLKNSPRANLQNHSHQSFLDSSSSESEGASKRTSPRKHTATQNHQNDSSEKESDEMDDHLMDKETSSSKKSMALSTSRHVDEPHTDVMAKSKSKLPVRKRVGHTENHVQAVEAEKRLPSRKRHKKPEHQDSDTEIEIMTSPPKMARHQASPDALILQQGLLNSSATFKERHGHTASTRSTKASIVRKTTDSTTNMRRSLLSSFSAKSKEHAEKASTRKENPDDIDLSDVEHEKSEPVATSPARRQLRNKAALVQGSSNAISSAKYETEEPSNMVSSSVVTKRVQPALSAAGSPKQVSKDRPMKVVKRPKEDKTDIHTKGKKSGKHNANAGNKGSEKTEASMKEGQDNELRRSKRNRVGTLARHIGQRIIYKLDAHGLPVVDCIEEGSKHTKKFHSKKTTKLRKPDKRPEAVVQQIENSFLNNDEVDDVPLESVLVINPETNEEVYIDCIRVKNSFIYVGPSGENVSQNDPMIMTKPLEQKAFASGVIVIRPLQEKGSHYVHQDAMIFWVIKGKVEVTVHQTTVILGDMDTFFVPPGNKYNIKNLTDTSAKLVFFQHKREMHPVDIKDPRL